MSIYKFEDYSLDVPRRELRRGSDVVTMEPLVFDVLEYLVRNRERLVSKNDLIADVWDGRIVSDSTLSSRITAVRQALGDSGKEQKLVRTVSRKGFRFVGKIHAENGATPSLIEPTPSAELKLPDRPSIVVLPFENFSGDPEQAYFADGVVDEIITALSRLPWLFVIARSSSFTYKNRAVDVRQIGRELGVRYVLEGSIRKDGGRVRILAQLIDALTGTHLSAERFEGALDDIFRLQDELTSSVVGAIAPKLQQAEIERAKQKPTESLDAYDHFLRGQAHLYERTRDCLGQALQAFAKAVELDPDFSAAYGMAAWVYVRRKGARWVTDVEQEKSEAIRLARKAVSGRNDPMAFATAGFALAYVGEELDAGAAWIDRALALNPNLAFAWIFSGWTRILLGEQDTAIKHFTDSIRFSPLDPYMMSTQSGIAFAHFLAGRDREASEWAERAIRDHPQYFFANVVCACTRAVTGQHAAAQTALLRVRELDPALRVSTLRDLEPLRRPEHLAKFENSFRLAGLPE